MNGRKRIAKNENSQHRVESLYNCKIICVENCQIICVKCYCLILYTEYIEGKFRSFSIIPERALLISLRLLELHRVRVRVRVRATKSYTRAGV